MRHPNGGAEKLGLEAHVSSDSFCDRSTEIDGDSSVFQSTLKDVTVIDSKVFDSHIEMSWLYGSDCAKSTLQGLFARECILDRVVASNDRSQGALVLKDVVAETCELHGTWWLEGNARIPTGIWYRAPRFRRITGENGVDIGLTESTEGYALMACWRKPITQWIKAGPRLGRLHGWTEDQIRAAKEFYEELADIRMEGVRI